VHNIDVIWHYCDIPGCTFRAKQIGNLKKHRAAVSAHQPQALAQQTWFYCGMKGCDFRAKSNNLVTQHKDEVSIGVVSEASRTRSIELFYSLIAG